MESNCGQDQYQFNNNVFSSAFQISNPNAQFTSVRWFNKRLPSFLLDLLEDPSGQYKPYLSWINPDQSENNFSNLKETQIPSGHFILTQPDKVAQLWGIRTQNFTMNYDKFARAMRHYYANLKINSNDGVIRKVNGANYTYQFTKFNEYLYSIETGSRTNRLYTLLNGKFASNAVTQLNLMGNGGMADLGNFSVLQNKSCSIMPVNFSAGKSIGLDNNSRKRKLSTETEDFSKLVLLDKRTFRLSYTRLIIEMLDSDKLTSETADKLLSEYWKKDD